MIAIKNMEMPTDCKKCTLMGTDGDPRDLLSPMMCIAIWATTHEKKHCVSGKIRDDCPLVEIEEHKVEKLEKIEQIVNSEVDPNICNNVDYVRKVQAIKKVLDQE